MYLIFMAMNDAILMQPIIRVMLILTRHEP